MYSRVPEIARLALIANAALLGGVAPMGTFMMLKSW